MHDDPTKTKTAADVLKDIGEEPSLPKVEAEVPPFSPVQPDPVPEALRTPTIEAIELAIGAGMMPADHLPLLDWIEIAPDMIVRASRLRWHKRFRMLVYQCANGDFHYIDRVARALKFGGDAVPWMPAPVAPATQAYYTANPDIAASSDSSLPLGCRAMQRFAAELGCIIRVVEAQRYEFGPDEKNRTGRLIPAGVWHACCDRGQYRLVDTNVGNEARFDSLSAGMAAAEKGLLGEDKRYCWLPAAIPDWCVPVDDYIDPDTGNPYA